MIQKHTCELNRIHHLRQLCQRGFFVIILCSLWRQPITEARGAPRTSWGWSDRLHHPSPHTRCRRHGHLFEVGSSSAYLSLCGRDGGAQRGAVPSVWSRLTSSISNRPASADSATDAVGEWRNCIIQHVALFTQTAVAVEQQMVDATRPSFLHSLRQWWAKITTVC